VLFRCSEDPDVKGTETETAREMQSLKKESCSEDPDVKGTETVVMMKVFIAVHSCSEDPDVKGTETSVFSTLYIACLVAARIPM